MNRACAEPNNEQVYGNDNVMNVYVLIVESPHETNSYHSLYCTKVKAKRAAEKLAKWYFSKYEEADGEWVNTNEYYAELDARNFVTVHLVKETVELRRPSEQGLR